MRFGLYLGSWMVQTMIVTFSHTDIAPNELPAGAITLEDGTIKVECSPDEMSKWIKTLPIAHRERIFALTLLGIMNGDIKLA